MSKIDTQGMSMPIDPSDPKYKKTWNMQPHKPMMIEPRRVHTPEIVKELKILINEVLDEREGKTGQSYFDSNAYKHSIDEEEPPYEAWQ